VGIPGELVGVVCVIEGPFGMPIAGRVVAFLVVFRRGSMGARRKFMLFGGLPV